jgi:hypothetical protein
MKRKHRCTGGKSPGRPPKDDRRLVGLVTSMSRQTGLSERVARDLIIALFEGRQVEPTEKAKQRHQERLVKGWALISFALPNATFEGRSGTLKRKKRRGAF